MDPHRGEEGDCCALKAYVDRGAQGVKLMGAIHKYNVDDPMVIPFVEAARDLGIVVSIHSGRDNCSAERIGNVARQVPDVPIIMDHMGFPDGFDTALEVCRECPDVYLGTTILRFHKLWAINPEETVPHEVKQAVVRIRTRTDRFWVQFAGISPDSGQAGDSTVEIGRRVGSTDFRG